MTAAFSQAGITRVLVVAMGLISAALSLGSPYVYAAEMNLQSQIRVETGHNSNLRMAQTSGDAVLNNDVIATASVVRRTETSDLSLNGSFEYSDYSNAAPDVRNRDREFLQILFRKRWDRWAMGTNASMRRDDLLRTFRTAAADDVFEDDLQSGDQPVDTTPDISGGDEQNEDTEQIRRLILQGSVYGQYELAERHRLRTTLGVGVRDYSGNATNRGLRDSNRISAAVEHAYDLDDRSVLTSQLSAAKLDPDEGISSNLYQGLVSWQRRLSQRSQLRLGSGISYVEAGSSTDVGYILDARYRLRMAGGDVGLQLKRSLIPNAFGNVSETDTFRLRLRRNLNGRSSVDFGTTAGRRTRTTDATSSDRSERKFVRARVGYTLSLGKNWRSGVSYAYSWIDRDRPDNGSTATTNNSGSAKGHTGKLFFEYRRSVTR